MKGRWAPRLRSLGVWPSFTFTVITATFLFIALWLVPNYTTSWQTRVKNLSRLVAWLRKDPESNPWPLDLMPYPLHRHVRLDSRYCTHPLRKYAVNQSNFIIFFHSRFYTEFGKGSFSYVAAIVWNGLPLDMRQFSINDIFKQCLLGFPHSL